MPAKSVGATGNTTGKVRYGDTELADVNIYGHTPNMVDIDTRTISQGRYFTDAENQRVGAGLPDRRQPGAELFRRHEPAGEDQSELSAKSTRSSGPSRRSAAYSDRTRTTSSSSR